MSPPNPRDLASPPNFAYVCSMRMEAGFTHACPLLQLDSSQLDWSTGDTHGLSFSS